MTTASPRTIELLAPARDLDCGRAAIDCGADAVYVGAPLFGARERAGNTLADIASLVEHAHRYRAQVYVTLNTLLHDRELPDAAKLIHDLWQIEVDAVIIQDMGLLELGLPPMPFFASTQCHNHRPERVLFLEKMGFQRVILARELGLAEITAIRRQTNVDLEVFVFGALCVSFSGRCTLSQALGGRSANRGRCAQPCRLPWRLEDGQGHTKGPAQHWLSLKDMDRSAHLDGLLDAGVRSFKIEGRLKDRAYVMNAVAWLRQALDPLLARRGWRAAASGTSEPGFSPAPHKTFNRGFSAYLAGGRESDLATLHSPKSMGEPLGQVQALRGGGFILHAQHQVRPGDGLCFLDNAGTLRGSTVFSVQGEHIVPREMHGLQVGTAVWRNVDRDFLAALDRARPRRTLDVALCLTASTLDVCDEDGVMVQVPLPPDSQPARQPAQARQVAARQLKRLGDSEFRVVSFTTPHEQIPFLPVSAWNALRREWVARLRAARLLSRPRLPARSAPSPSFPFPETALDFQGNVLNAQARAFYARHGAQVLEPAAESGLDLTGRVVMTTRYCLRFQLGRCAFAGAAVPAHVDPGAAQHTREADEALVLVGPDGQRLRLQFQCRRCVMEAVFLGRAGAGAVAAGQE